MATTRLTVVYHRNNPAVCAAMVLAFAAWLLWTWLGLLTFIVGTVVGAWQWIRKIRTANECLTHTRLDRRPTPHV
jgi:hypothetical protein